MWIGWRFETLLKGQGLGIHGLLSRLRASASLPLCLERLCQEGWAGLNGIQMVPDLPERQETGGPVSW